MSIYIPQTSPTAPVDPRIPAFFERFYAISDDTSLYDEFADSWIADGIFMNGLTEAVGRDQILKARRDLVDNSPWEWSRHLPQKMFSFGKETLDVMSFGTLELGFADGKLVKLEWALRAVFVEYNGSLKIKYYHPYCVCLSPLTVGQPC